jgi:hypothetical protein
MHYLFMAMICSIVGVVPLAMKKRLGASMTMGFISTIVLWFFFWLATASIVGPFFGPCFSVVFVLWVIATIIDARIEGEITWIIFFPVVLFIIRFIIAPFGSSMFRSHEFATLVGPMEEKVWTQDVQPKDPRHIRLSNIENAIYMAKNSISKGGNLGSQFQVVKKNMTLQKINNVFWFVVPLDFKDDYGVWSNTHVTPGYIMVSAEDDETEPVFKTLPDNKKLRYTPNAFFGFDLERHLRMNGYLNVGLIDYTFEVDDNGDPWWVVSTYQPTIINDGEKVTGVVVVNPTTGDIISYSLDKIPEWIDRAMPKEMVKQYLSWWGEYSGGWMNSWWSRLNLLEPEEPILVYGSDNTLDWVIGMTSKSKTDTALVGLVYANSRTGKATYYKTNGGSTDKAILEAVENNGYVKNKVLHPADPQIYNLYGTMASIMPLLNASHARQGVAIVEVTDVQKVAIGVDMNEALNAYQEMIGNKAKAVMDKTRAREKVNGVVDRIHQEFQTTGTIYRIHLKDIPHLFVGGKGLSRKITVTESGDEVNIEYYASGEEEEPMYKFDNLSLPLEKSTAQEEVTEKAVRKMDEQRDRIDGETTKERIKELTPQQLKEIEKLIPPK